MSRYCVGGQGVLWAGIAALALSMIGGKSPALRAAELAIDNAVQSRRITTPPAVGSLQSDMKNELIAQLLPLTRRRGRTRRPANSRTLNSADGYDRVSVVKKGGSSRRARKAGLRAVPLQKLSRTNRHKAEQVLNSVSVFRQLPILAFEVDPNVYGFFLSHPDVAVSIWRAMGISKFRMWQTGPVTYEADAGDGTSGAVEVLYQSPQESLVLCDGEFKSPLLSKPLHAEALMHLRTVRQRSRDGRTFVRHHLNLFVHFPSTTVETAAKLVSPVSNLIVDRNFREVSLFLNMMSLAMAKRPDWVEQIAGKLDGVLEIRRTQLMEVTAKVHGTARKRDIAAGQGNTRTSMMAPAEPTDPTLNPTAESAKTSLVDASVGPTVKR